MAVECILTTYNGLEESEKGKSVSDYVVRWVSRLRNAIKGELSGRGVHIIEAGCFDEIIPRDTLRLKRVLSSIVGGDPVKEYILVLLLVLNMCECGYVDRGTYVSVVRET